MKNEVQEVKDKAQKIVDEIDSEKVVAETKLEAARPALEEAEAALNVSSALLSLPTQVLAGAMFRYIKLSYGIFVIRKRNWVLNVICNLWVLKQIFLLITFPKFIFLSLYFP